MQLDRLIIYASAMMLVWLAWSHGFLSLVWKYPPQQQPFLSQLVHSFGGGGPQVADSVQGCL